MYTHHKVIWSEGMFLQQQDDRYAHPLYLNRRRAFKTYHSIIEKLAIDKPSLRRGKYALAACRVILANGTAVGIPDQDSAPLFSVNRRVPPMHELFSSKNRIHSRNPMISRPDDSSRHRVSV